MGSEFFKKSGLDRCGDDLAEDYPEKFTIVDLDVPAEKLRHTFAGNALALEMIERARDTTRITGNVPAWFIAAGEDADFPAVEFVCIGPDSEGNVYNLILDGRQRVITRRIWNERRAAQRPKLPPSTIKGMPHKFRKLEGAGLSALITKASTGITVPPSLETRADRAAEFKGMSVKACDIAIRLGLPGGEDEAKELLDWASIFSQLSPLAKVEANAGRLKIRKARKLASMTPKEQDEALAPKPERKPRASKPMQRRAVERIRSELMAPCGESSEDALIWELLSLVTGELEPGKIRSDKLRAAYLRATERGK